MGHGEGRGQILVAIDLSAAFDTVDHDIMLDVLNKKFGIQDDVLNWFSSYLNNRRFKVCLEDTYSQKNFFNCSVPQGSCLGPSLFCLYASSINDIVPADLNLSAFADDHTIYRLFTPSVEIELDIKKSMELILLNVHSWMNENRLKMNMGKTEFIAIGSHQQLKKINTNNLQVVHDIIERSDSVQLLGAYLDKNLNFNEHVNYKCRSAMWG